MFELCERKARRKAIAATALRIQATWKPSGKKWYKLNPFTEIDLTRGFNLYHSVPERNLRGSCEGKGKCPQVMCDAGTNIE